MMSRIRRVGSLTQRGTGLSIATRCFSVLLSQRHHHQPQQRPHLFLRDKRDGWLVPTQTMSTAAAITELPYHLVVGLPALSPTMASGTLAEWYLKEGDSFSAGDGLAKIETDKAAMDFEAQDDGFVAKILIPAGGNDGTFL
jgi:biotin carboxyl carrier protein